MAAIRQNFKKPLGTAFAGDIMSRLKFAIVGYGRMGKLVEQALRDAGEEILSIIDPETAAPWKGSSLQGADSAICFTAPQAGYETTKRVLGGGVDAVVATTKFYLDDDGSERKDMIEEFDQIAKQNNARMIYASNFSIGMNAYWQALRQMAPLMASIGYDVAVEERHHSRKADISGTAKTIANILLESYPGKSSLSFWDCERKRGEEEITVASTRVGHIAGTHTVVFDSPTDTIELVHRVRDPRIFAIGAVESAYWLRDKEPGVYNITDRLE